MDAEAVRSRRSPDARLPLLDQLSRAPVRGLPGEPLPAADVVLTWAIHRRTSHALGRTPAERQHRRPARHAHQPRRASWAAASARSRSRCSSCSWAAIRRRCCRASARAGADDEVSPTPNRRTRQSGASVITPTRCLRTEDAVEQESSRRLGGEYRNPTLVLFNGAVDSGCGVSGIRGWPVLLSGGRGASTSTSTSSTAAAGTTGARGDFARRLRRRARSEPSRAELARHLRTVQRDAAAPASAEVEGNQLSVRLELQGRLLCRHLGKPCPERTGFHRSR